MGTKSTAADSRPVKVTGKKQLGNHAAPISVQGFPGNPNTVPHHQSTAVAVVNVERVISNGPRQLTLAQQLGIEAPPRPQLDETQWRKVGDFSNRDLQSPLATRLGYRI